MPPTPPPLDFENFWDNDFRAWAADLLTGPIVLSPEYLKAIEAVENDPRNQNGSDKSWVWQAEVNYREHFAKAVLLE